MISHLQFRPMKFCPGDIVEVNLIGSCVPEFKDQGRRATVEDFGGTEGTLGTTKFWMIRFHDTNELLGVYEAYLRKVNP